MIFSVWNQGTSQFDYFETDELQQKLNAPKPSHLVQRTLGATPEQAAWPLPRNARPIGTGPNAIGRVAAHKNSGALGDAASDNAVSVSAVLLLVGGALLTYHLLSPKPRRRA